MYGQFRHLDGHSRPSRRRENEIADRLNRLSVGPVIYTPPGIESEHINPWSFLSLYELTADPALDDDSREYYATAKPVFQRWCTVDVDGHWVANAWQGGGTVSRARRQDDPIAGAATSEETIWFPANSRDANQESSGPPSFKSGDRVFVTQWFLAKSVVGGAGAAIRAVELKTTLTPGASATGWTLTWNSTSNDYDEPTYTDDPDVTVYDPMSLFRSIGYDDVASGRGAIVTVDQNSVVQSGRQQAKRIRGTLGGALTTSTASQTISSPVAMDGGQVPSGTITGYNVYTTKGHAGPSGGVCAAEWNESTDHYEFYDVECT